jgi:hypothetical protein
VEKDTFGIGVVERIKFGGCGVEVSGSTVGKDIRWIRSMRLIKRLCAEELIEVLEHSVVKALDGTEKMSFGSKAELYPVLQRE